VREARCDEVRYAFLTDAVLRHLDGLDAVVGGVGFGPGAHAAVLQSVATADYELEVGDLLAFLARGGFLCGECRERIGDEDAGCGAETVVVEVEVAEGCVLRQEVYERGNGVEAEGVVGEIDSVEVWQCEERGEEVG
jgi:hypothetical protein